MLKARSVVVVDTMDELKVLKEFLFLELVDSGVVEEIEFFRDRIDGEGKARTDMTLTVTPTDTGRYPKGAKNKIKKIVGTNSIVLAF